MMISFGWTTPALLAGRKTVTRRDWSAGTVARARRAFEAGEAIDAWNTSPRNVRGNPHRIGKIRLTAEPRREATRLVPVEDYEREGFAYLDEHGILLNGRKPIQLFEEWEDGDGTLVVVRFVLLEIYR